MNDLYISKSNGHFSVFVLPDLAKSDTVDHSTVLEASSALGFQETTMATYVSHWLSLRSLMLVSHPLKNRMTKGSVFRLLFYSQLLEISPNLMVLETINKY